MSDIRQFDFWITKASQDAEGIRRWSCVGSDTDPDHFDDEMSIELFRGFVEKIDSNTLVPEKWRSDYWQGGMPYLSLSHYSDGNGESVPGDVEEVYIDGNRLKSKGTFSDSPLGIACFEAVEESVQKTRSKIDEFKPVRISIGFLDFKHEHKSDGSIFVRESLTDVCEHCVKELDAGDGQGIRYLDGQLIHLAMTREPVNGRTSIEVERSMTTQKEDAASIVGEELAEEVSNAEKELAETRRALVVKSETETDEASEAEKTKANLTLAEAMLSVERSEEAWKVDDVFWTLNDVVWDILFSMDGKEAFPQPEQMKSAVTSVMEEARDLITRSLFVMEPKNLSKAVEPVEEEVEAPEVEEVEISELDQAWQTLKSKFEELDKSDPENMKELQSEYEALALEINRSFGGTEPVAEEVDETPDVAQIVQAEVQKAIAPLVEQLKVTAEAKPAPAATVQRGITSPQILQVNDPNQHQVQGQTQPKEELSSISRMINRSVQLPENFERPGASKKTG